MTVFDYAAIATLAVLILWGVAGLLGGHKL
jgi:hypothetical protein